MLVYSKYILAVIKFVVIFVLPMHEWHLLRKRLRSHAEDSLDM